MITDQDVKRIKKVQFDALCPYCRSRAVYLLGAHRVAAGALGGLSGHSQEGAYVEDWCCAICRRSFELY